MVFSAGLGPEPRPEEALEMLQGLKARYETHHGVMIADEALGAAAKLSVAGCRTVDLPDKALDLLDEAGAGARIRQSASRPKESQGLSSLLARWRKCWGSGRESCRWVVGCGVVADLPVLFRFPVTHSRGCLRRPG